MAKKRKLSSKSAESTQNQQTEEEEQRQHVEEEHLEDNDNEDDMQEDEHEIADEVDDENEGTNAVAVETDNQSVQSLDQNQNNDVDANEDEDEAVEKLLEPFSKEQLIDLLSEAADKHADVEDRIRGVADEDPAHRKIFVHGLGWDANSETLIHAFKQYGEIEDCKVVTDKTSGKSKGYGFILFKSRSGARKSLKQPQKKIGNRMTACQLATVGAMPSAMAAAPSQPVSEYAPRKIYVSNVKAELDPQKLITFFSKYGEIEEGPLGLDKQTGKPKGFCLFVYKTIESAKKALEEPHKNFEGHILHCQKAIDGPKPNKPHPHQRKQSTLNVQNPSFIGNARGTGAGHLMAPTAVGGLPFNQGAAAAQALNPALGQAFTAFLANQGAAFGLTNLFGTLGAVGVSGVVNPAMPRARPGMQGGYGNQGAGAGVGPGMMGGYGNQGGYPNQQTGQGGSGRTQHGVEHMGGMGH